MRPCVYCGQLGADSLRFPPDDGEPEPFHSWPTCSLARAAVFTAARSRFGRL
jgi:hypothetical protein